MAEIRTNLTASAACDGCTPYPRTLPPVHLTSDLRPPTSDLINGYNSYEIDQRVSSGKYKNWIPNGATRHLKSEGFELIQISLNG